MSDDLARASMYALRAIVGALRDSGVITEDVIDAMEQQTSMAVNYASVLQSSAAVPPDPNEAANIRHGIWWARECIAPTANFEPGPIGEHPRHLHEWPKLGDSEEDGG